MNKVNICDLPTLLSLSSGNGTLNKQAGIDYKQLSLLAKINENQSGEVSPLLSVLVQFRQVNFHHDKTCCGFNTDKPQQKVKQKTKESISLSLSFSLWVAMAGSLAGGWDRSEGAAGERLDHKEEPRL